MAIATHRFVSAKSDSDDASRVRASAWNDGHVFTGGSHGMVLTRSTSVTDGATWTPGPAVGATTADDINAITLAVETAGGGEVYLAPGTYQRSTPLLLRKGVSLRGSKTGTIITKATGFTGNLVEMAEPSGDQFLRYAVLDGMTIQNGSADALHIDGAAEFAFRNLIISNCTAGYGLYIRDSIVGDFTNSRIDGCNIGLLIDDRVNAFKVGPSVRIRTSKHENVIVQGNDDTINDTISAVIESSGATAAAAGILVRSGIKALTITQCHLEANRNASHGQIVIEADSSEAVAQVAIHDNWIVGSGVSDYAVEILGGGALVFERNYTAGHDASVYLASGIGHVTLREHGRNDPIFWTGPGLPYVVEYNGGIQIVSDLTMTGAFSQKVEKTGSGNLSMQSPGGTKVFINGEEFPA